MQINEIKSLSLVCLESFYQAIFTFSLLRYQKISKLFFSTAVRKFKQKKSLLLGVLNSIKFSTIFLKKGVPYGYFLIYLCEKLFQFVSSNKERNSLIIRVYCTFPGFYGRPWTTGNLKFQKKTNKLNHFIKFLEQRKDLFRKVSFLQNQVIQNKCLKLALNLPFSSRNGA